LPTPSGRIDHLHSITCIRSPAFDHLHSIICIRSSAFDHLQVRVDGYCRMIDAHGCWKAIVVARDGDIVTGAVTRFADSALARWAILTWVGCLVTARGASGCVSRLVGPPV
jgi:hypothetical protein